MRRARRRWSLRQPPLLATPSRRALPPGGLPNYPQRRPQALRPRPVVSVLQPLAARQPTTRAEGALNSTPLRGPDAGRPVAGCCAGATLAAHSSAEQGQVAQCMRIAAGNGGRGAPWTAYAAAEAVTAAAASKAATPRFSPYLVPPAAGSIAGRIGAGHSSAPLPLGPPPRHAWPPGGQPDRPREMVPMRCHPAQWLKAAAAGHMEACDIHQRAAARPSAGLSRAESPAPSHAQTNQPCSRAQLPPIGRFTRASEGIGAWARLGLPPPLRQRPSPQTSASRKPRSLAVLQHYLPLGYARRASVQVTFCPHPRPGPLLARVGAGGSLRPPPDDSPAALQPRSGVYCCSGGLQGGRKVLQRRAPLPCAFA